MSTTRFKALKRLDDRWTVHDVELNLSAIPLRFENDGLEYSEAVLLTALLNTLAFDTSAGEALWRQRLDA